MSNSNTERASRGHARADNQEEERIMGIPINLGDGKAVY
jgi:hypothetical protein